MNQFQINPRRWKGLFYLLPETAPLKEGDARKAGRAVSALDPVMRDALASAADTDCEVYIAKTREHAYKCGCDACTQNLLTLDEVFPDLRSRMGAHIRGLPELLGVVATYDPASKLAVVICSPDLPYPTEAETAGKPFPDCHRSFIWTGDIENFHRYWRAV